MWRVLEEAERGQWLGVSIWNHIHSFHICYLTGLTPFQQAICMTWLRSILIIPNSIGPTVRFGSNYIVLRVIQREVRLKIATWKGCNNQTVVTSISLEHSPLWCSLRWIRQHWYVYNRYPVILLFIILLNIYLFIYLYIYLFIHSLIYGSN